MTLTNTELGKAYEYACVMSLISLLSGRVNGMVSVVATDGYKVAQNAFHKAEKEGLSERLMRAADAAAAVIIRLEPQLEYGDGALTFTIQSDFKGIAGDVRDIVCSRRAANWQIGISCKHNHDAVKHGRLSPSIDFGAEWFGVPCSREYFDDVVPVFEELRQMKTDASERGDPIPSWSGVRDKDERYYMPVLNAFLKELRRLAENNEGVPGKLVEYMLGRYDFYKAITDDRHEITRIDAINISGALNRPANHHRSVVKVPKLKLPSRFYHTGIKKGSTNIAEIVCDEGWTLSMHIHNASSRIEPSLKFDVSFKSLPASFHTQIIPWRNQSEFHS